METLNIKKTTKERFIVYMGILQQVRKQSITQDQALTQLLDSFREVVAVESSGTPKVNS